MVCIRCSELTDRYCNIPVCALLVRSRRWSWCTHFLGLPSPCSVGYYEPSSLVLFEGTQLNEKVHECTLLTTIQIHSQTSPPGLGILLPQRIRMGNTNFHGFPKNSTVRASARHLAQSFQVILHSCIPRTYFVPRIRYARFSTLSRSREPQKTHVFLT